MDKINSVLKLREVVDKIFDDINNKHCCPPEPTEWLMYSQKCSEIHTDTKKPESFLMNYIRRIVDRISDIIMPLEPLDIPEEEFIVAHGYKFWHLLDNYFNEYCAKKKCARSEILKRANVTRAVYHNIKNIQNGDQYIPKKITVLSLCIGLHLNVLQTQELLNTLGYSLSDYILVDRVVAWCLEQPTDYTVYDINDAIYEKTHKSPFVSIN